MTRTKAKISLESDYVPTARTGVSLHCHTKYSKEFLDFVPFYADKYPIVSSLYKMGCRRFEKKYGHSPNLNLGHWEPPLEADQLIRSESDSLRSMQLDPIVSITEHDSIQAGIDLHSAGNERHPISMEWTVPFGDAYFHVGVHNLPPSRAREIERSLLEYTFGHGKRAAPSLDDVMLMLNREQEILIVLNHPFWDIEMIGQKSHDEALRSFTKKYRNYIHAIELNGFRPWPENHQARELAEQLDLPIVSGGDRHCLHANCMINVTNAASFSEFVDEVRKDKQSHVVIRPEYSRSLTHRQVSSIAQILGKYPAFPEDRRHWSQRVYFDWEDGRGLDSLASRWSFSEPLKYRCLIKAFGLLGSSWLTGLWKLIDPAMKPAALRSALTPVDILETPDLWPGHSRLLEPQAGSPAS